MTDAIPAGPLSDLLVLDLTRALAGPHAAMMLGDMGARVIKIESPPATTPGVGPPFVGEADERGVDVLPLRQPQQGVAGPRPQVGGGQGRPGPADRARRRADGELPGGRPRPARFPVERLHELNPGLVVLSITGFGHDGPEAKRAGYDQIAQGEAA